MSSASRSSRRAPGALCCLLFEGRRTAGPPCVWSARLLRWVLLGGSLALLVPGLLMVGVGMGLCITPLATTVLSSADSQRAGAVSGALSTTQQVGNAFGVAISGGIFFASLSWGYPRAFQAALVELAFLMVLVALLIRLLPQRRATS